MTRHQAIAAVTLLFALAPLLCSQPRPRELRSELGAEDTDAGWS